MKIREFAEKYEGCFSLEELTKSNLYGTMDKWWEACNDPCKLLDVLRGLGNPNYSLAIIDYIIKCTDICFDKCQHASRNVIKGGRASLVNYYDNPELDLKESYSKYEMEMRQCIQSNIDVKQNKAIYAVNVALVWLKHGKGSLSILMSGKYMTKQIIMAHIAEEPHLANLLRECVGNPFLT